MSMRRLRRIALLLGMTLPSSATAADIVNGLNAEFFGDHSLTRSLAKRVDPNVDWHWSTAHPQAGLPADFFSVRWSGWIKAPRPGAYKLILIGDDGFRLKLDGLSMIDKWRGGFNNASVTAELTGRAQKIEIEYFEIDRGAWLTFWWQPLGASTPSVVPTYVLFPDETSAASKARSKRPSHGLVADYFSGGFKKRYRSCPVHRTEAVWGNWAPEPGAPVNGCARITGYLTPVVGGRYQLVSYADDRLRVWIDGKPVLESRFGQTGGRSSAFIELDADTAHIITMEYEEFGGWGSYFLHWIPPNTNEEVPIPGELLYPLKQSIPRGKRIVK